MSAPPPTWVDAVTRQMRLYDTDLREEWKADLDRNNCVVLGLFLDGSGPVRRLVLAPAWSHPLEEPMWSSFGAQATLALVTEIIGKLRGDHDESLTPTWGKARLMGAGLTYTSIDRTGAKAYGFILSDIQNNHFSRMHMGGDKAFSRHFYHDPTTTSFEEAVAADQIRPEHVALSALLFASLASPEKCRERFGVNDVDETLGGMKDLITRLDPHHPLNPARVN